MIATSLVKNALKIKQIIVELPTCFNKKKIVLGSIISYDIEF